MPEQEIWVERVDNGFEVRWLEETEDFNITHHKRVFEADEDDDWGDQEAMMRCLWFIIYHFGLVGSKHDKKRLRVDLTEGKE